MKIKDYTLGFVSALLLVIAFGVLTGFTSQSQDPVGKYQLCTQQGPKSDEMQGYTVVTIIDTQTGYVVKHSLYEY